MSRSGFWVCLLPALLGGAGAMAQSDDARAERAHIAAERERIAQRVDAEQRDCYQRFAVNACLKASRAAERTELDALRRQEIVLNDRDRERKAASQLEKLDDKRQADQAEQASRTTAPPPSPRTPPQPSGRRPAAPASPRMPDSAQAQQHEEAMRRKVERNAQANAHRAEQAAKTAEETQRYEARQKEAAEYKARVQQRNAGKPSTAQPLPAP